MTDFGRKPGDMLKADYDTDEDSVVDSIPSHASTHEDGGSDEVDTTDLAGHVVGGAYVDRGDPSAYDLQKAGMVIDGNYHEWDLSSIVPAGAIAVHLEIQFDHAAVGKSVMFRKNGNSNFYNRLAQLSQVADVDIHFDGFVSLDATRKIEYTTSTGTFGNIAIVVRGWLI